jgi:hypothetical protein
LTSEGSIILVNLEIPASGSPIQINANPLEVTASSNRIQIRSEASFTPARTFSGSLS